MDEATRKLFGRKLRHFRNRANLSQVKLARLIPISTASLSRYESGHQAVDLTMAARLDQLLNADGALSILLAAGDSANHADMSASDSMASPGDDQLSEFHLSDASDEIVALELSRRAEASDVGNETLSHLEDVVDDIACQYPITPPSVLLEQIRPYLSYATILMDKRKKLSEHRRLLVVGGWLSLLSATVLIDLKLDRAAFSYLRTASSVAREAGHDEIRAWCYETEAWRVLTNGNHAHALRLTRAAQSLAPKGSSVAIQSIAQEGRALARMARITEMHSAVDRVQRLVSPMTRPDSPEHHYRYDPDKSVSYTATTLAWAGDPAGEEYAREVIARLSPSDDIETWPRRVASANLDLALTLVASRRFEEASEAAKNAILSGRVVPSNRWRALEVVRSFEQLRISEAKELREAYNDTSNHWRRKSPLSNSSLS